MPADKKISAAPAPNKAAAFRPDWPEFIAAVSYLLPEALVRGMSFTTYHRRPAYCSMHLIGTLPDRDTDWHGGAFQGFAAATTTAKTGPGSFNSVNDVTTLTVTDDSGATGVAHADAPDQWADNPSVSPLHVLLVLVLALFVSGPWILRTLIDFIAVIADENPLLDAEHRSPQLVRLVCFPRQRGPLDRVASGGIEPREIFGIGEHDHTS